MICWGCRAKAEMRAIPSDAFPGDPIPDGMQWERFECSQCGVPDVRLVRAVTGEAEVRLVPMMKVPEDTYIGDCPVCGDELPCRHVTGEQAQP